MPPQTTGATMLGRPSTLNLPWQAKAWRFYGAPDGTIGQMRVNQGAIGEVRFVMGWVAQQIGRIEWHVVLDGKELSAQESATLMKKVANQESTINIATNLIVAGELNYIAVSQDKLETLTGDPKWEALAGPLLPGDDEAKWIVMSVIDTLRKDALEQSELNLRAIWPHPAKSTMPDPPLRSVLDVLDEIEQIQDLAFSQNRSRIAQMGILTVATEFDLATPGGDFGARLEEAINAPIVDPRKTTASPILLRGPFELMTGALSNGARAVQWTKPGSEGFDERLDEKMKFQIQRLAWGFPVAPEILLGMTATNRAVAFQIEESTYRSHIEPIARLVGRVYARALKMLIEEDVKAVEVNPDATELLARRHSVADAKDLYDRGLVRAEFIRRVAGIKDEDAATDEDLERIVLLRKGGNPGEAREPDPSEVAGNEPVRASLTIDEGLFSALHGALSMAHNTAVSRVGAAARTKLARRELTPPFEIDPELATNSRLPSLLGPDRLTELGVDIDKALDMPAKMLSTWWGDRLTEEGHNEIYVADACAALEAAFQSWSATAITAWPIARVPSYVADCVLSVPIEAGGE